MSLHDDTKRAARVYRNAWAELGRRLGEMAAGGDYRDEGYGDFETYCARELGFGNATARKLMAGYGYLRRHGGEKLAALARGEAVTLPSPETAVLLDQAQRRGGPDGGILDELRLRALHAPISEEAEREIRRRLRPPSAAAAAKKKGREK